LRPPTACARCSNLPWSTTPSATPGCTPISATSAARCCSTSATSPGWCRASCCASPTSSSATRTSTTSSVSTTGCGSCWDASRAPLPGRAARVARWGDSRLAAARCVAVVGQDGVRGGHSSVQPDGRVEVPGPADFDHVELAGQCRRERRVGSVAFHDAPYRFVDFRHAAGKHEGH